MMTQQFKKTSVALALILALGNSVAVPAIQEMAPLGFNIAAPGFIVSNTIPMAVVEKPSAKKSLKEGFVIAGKLLAGALGIVGTGYAVTRFARLRDRIPGFLNATNLSASERLNIGIDMPNPVRSTENTAPYENLLPRDTFFLSDVGSH